MGSTMRQRDTATTLRLICRASYAIGQGEMNDAIRRLEIAAKILYAELPKSVAEQIMVNEIRNLGARRPPRKVTRRKQ